MAHDVIGLSNSSLRVNGCEEGVRGDEGGSEEGEGDGEMDAADDRDIGGVRISCVNTTLTNSSDSSPVTFMHSSSSLTAPFSTLFGASSLPPVSDTSFKSPFP